MSEEIRKIAEFTGKSEEQVAKELDMKDVSGKWTAYNRREENRVKTALRKAEEQVAREKEQKEFEEKLAAGTAVWRRVSGEWLVQVTGQEVKEGDIVTVERRNGTSSDELIKSIVTKNDQGIFARV